MRAMCGDVFEGFEKAPGGFLLFFGRNSFFASVVRGELSVWRRSMFEVADGTRARSLSAFVERMFAKAMQECAASRALGTSNALSSLY